MRSSEAFSAITVEIQLLFISWYTFFLLSVVAYLNCTTETEGDKKDEFHLEDWALPRKLGAKSLLRGIFLDGMEVV
jgi:hypothetical protein